MICLVTYRSRHDGYQEHRDVMVPGRDKCDIIHRVELDSGPVISIRDMAESALPWRYQMYGLGG